MASIRKEIALDADADKAWAAVSDFGAVATRLAPGFALESRLVDGDRRYVKFASGVEATETLVGKDDAARRLAYAIVGGRMAHYNAVVEIRAEGAGRSRLVWTIDLLPNDFAGFIDAQMETALKVMKPTLETAT